MGGMIEIKLRNPSGKGMRRPRELTARFLLQKQLTKEGNLKLNPTIPGSVHRTDLRFFTVYRPQFTSVNALWVLQIYTPLS
jgi:hypothetical protein